MAVAVGASVLLATPALAADPTSAENFSPDKLPATSGHINAAPMTISDRSDGSTTSNLTQHVTTVATAANTASVTYYLCTNYPADEVEAGGTDTLPTASGTGCTQVGEDTSGQLPGGPAAPAGSGEGYEAEIDIPATYESPTGGTNDFLAWVCSQNPKDDSNCDAEVEEDINMDDSGTGVASNQTSAGEITSPPHASGISNQGFTATASTSPDVTATSLCLVPADEGNGTAGNGDPVTCANAQLIEGLTGPTNPVNDQGNKKTWSGQFSAAAVPDDGEFALVLFEGNDTDAGGSGTYAGAPDGQLDSHYVVSSPAVPTSVKIALPDEGPAPTPNDCEESTSVNTGTGASPDDQSYQGCIFDQSGNLITNLQDWAFQVTPEDTAATVGNPLGLHSGDGAANDTNSNFFFEQENGNPNDAGADGRADTNVSFDTAGTYTVTFCVDSDNNASTAPGQSATPCSGEALSASATKTVTQPVDHVHVKRQGTEGPLCHTGSSSTTAQAGSTVNLVGCTLGVTPGGVEQPSAGNRVLWFVNPTAQPGDPGQIVSQENTTDAQGKADAAISSGAGAADKTSTIRFCVDEFPNPQGAGLGNGICDASEDTNGAAAGGVNPALQADFQISWTAQPGPGPDNACAKAKDKVKRVKKKHRQAHRADAGSPRDDRLERKLQRAKVNRARKCN